MSAPSRILNSSDRWEADLCDSLLAKGGGVVSATELAKRSGRARGAIVTDIVKGRLFGMPRQEEWLLLQDQVDPEGHPLLGLAETLEIFGGKHPLTVLQFLVTPDATLDGLSPLAALKQGTDWSARVCRSAAAHQGDGFA